MAIRSDRSRIPAAPARGGTGSPVSGEHGRRSAGWVPDPVPRDPPSRPAALGDRLPDGWRGARWALERPAALVTLLLCLAVAAVAGGLTALAVPDAPAPQPVPARAEVDGPAHGAAPEAGGAATPSPPQAPPATPAPEPSQTPVVVHVVGQVASPGVLELPAGSRVADAVESAGGLTGEADVTRVNLARPLVDGEQVHVPRPGEALAAAPAPPQEAGPGAAAAPGAAQAPGAAGEAPLDLNTAALADLDALPGIGPVLGQRILDWREANGRFSSVEELGEVSGIGEVLLDRLRPLVRV